MILCKHFSAASQAAQTLLCSAAETACHCTHFELKKPQQAHKIVIILCPLCPGAWHHWEELSSILWTLLLQVLVHTDEFLSQLASYQGWSAQLSKPFLEREIPSSSPFVIFVALCWTCSSYWGAHNRTQLSSCGLDHLPWPAGTAVPVYLNTQEEWIWIPASFPPPPQPALHYGILMCLEVVVVSGNNYISFRLSFSLSMMEKYVS